MDFKSNFSLICQSVIKDAKSYKFNFKDLPRERETKIRIHEKFSHIFDALGQKKNHCIYWFQFDDTKICSSVYNSLNEKRSHLKQLDRVVPVMGKFPKSDVLYLGIRRGGGYKRDLTYTHIVDRIRCHFGYLKSGKTQGLQFAHWATDFDITVTLNVYEFGDEIKELHLEAIEKLMAFELKPLCGKH